MIDVRWKVEVEVEVLGCGMWYVRWKVQDVVKKERRARMGLTISGAATKASKPRKLESGSWPAGVRDDQHRMSSAKLVASVTIDRG